jgi:methylated-DNA-[protein]-cysteine S-methyltransferase
MEPIWHYRVSSQVGVLRLAASNKGLRRLQFGEFQDLSETQQWKESHTVLAPYIEQLCAYFAGELRDFTFSLDLVGTEFQKKCWRALCRIPYGSTCTYADLAREVGSAKSFRAVGQANHRNPVAIVVPCHRVIGADGTLTGYGGGLPVKEMLLRLEGAAIQHPLKF